MNNHKAAQAALWMIRDTLNAAASQASRASDMFPGSDLCVAFHGLSVALANTPDLVEMAAVRAAIAKEEGRS
jgi:hypothetical protein